MRNQGGFTIVEIMVALVLSMLLVIGVTQIFLGNRDTYKVQNGLGMLEENARFAVEILRRDLSMAGYPNSMLVANPIDPVNTVDGGGTNPDMVGMNSYSDLNCAGLTQNPPVLTSRVYSIVVNPATGVSNLQCNSTVLLDGVENMQFLYGIDTDNDDSPNKYVNAGVIGTDQWTRIVTIRFALLINSVEPVSRVADSAVFKLLDVTIPKADDLLRRRAYFGTAVLRNNPQAFI